MRWQTQDTDALCKVGKKNNHQNLKEKAGIGSCISGFRSGFCNSENHFL